MNNNQKKLGQYLTDNHDYEGSNEEFLSITAPLIGYIVHSFNSLEELLNMAICGVISDRSDEIGANIIYKMSVSAKIDLYRRLVISLSNAIGTSFSSFPKLLEDLKQCNELRNAVVHAEWENMSSDGYTFVKLKFDANGMQQQYTQFTPDSLDKIDELIHTTYMELAKFDKERIHIQNKR